METFLKSSHIYIYENFSQVHKTHPMQILVFVLIGNSVQFDSIQKI